MKEVSFVSELIDQLYGFLKFSLLISRTNLEELENSQNNCELTFEVLTSLCFVYCLLFAVAFCGKTTSTTIFFLAS